MTMADIKALKTAGMLPMRLKNHFSVRLRVLGGDLSPDQLRTAADAADRFGRGKVHVTSRQGMEIPFVKFEDLEAMREFLAEGGLSLGIGGPTVRAVTACQGNKVCPWGCVDSQGFAREVSKKYQTKKLKCKFKIGVTGCANNCLKAEQNDIGVKGGLFSELDFSKCVGCGLCVGTCRAGALTLVKGERLDRDASGCVGCGKCVRVCPSGAWKGVEGYRVYFGGSFGNRIAVAREAFPMLRDKKDALGAMGAALDYFAENGLPGERFCNLLDRLGWDDFKNNLRETLGPGFFPESPEKSPGERAAKSRAQNGRKGRGKSSDKTGAKSRPASRVKKA
ncbi:MAG: 4Fe-4S binding protein [Deltaproteobacteria bacterium]|jgi:dissimilatory sulfite reductase (desulfoviridin) alpha/beta subunit|nr:4Fe-4S binding protein [Deltaproteobacteria bacterium]